MPYKGQIKLLNDLYDKLKEDIIVKQRDNVINEVLDDEVLDDEVLDDKKHKNI